ncbi:MAG: hypothetical protein NTW25_13675 [Candidatus Kapabacteria bacterium]|nr:hypothetical protein [Candidatus Kapabacteria bacterium]
MKNVILILSILFIASCGSDNNPTSSNQGKGQITYSVVLFDQYQNKLADQSGLTGQLYNENKLIQTALSDDKGIITFNNIEAGVYNFKFYKNNFIFYTNIDTLIFKNIQFVGAGKFNINEISGLSTNAFYSKVPFDTSYWDIPNITYEIIKNKVPTKIYIRDSTFYDSTTSYGHPKVIPIYSSGILEKWTVKFHADFPDILPNPTYLKRMTISLKPNRGISEQNIYNNFPFNQTSYDWVYESPNTFVFDSLGNNITLKTGNSGYQYGEIKIDSIDVQLYNSLSLYFGVHYQSQSFNVYSPKISVKLNY